MNNDLNVDVRTLRPFTRFIYTIGELPSSYLMSMTYQEQLTWFCNYLATTVIPTVNNNGLAVEELQQKYIELKNYVDTYFENLDVQEEIDNKIDEMAQDGTLDDIIADYIQLRGQLVYNTVAEMKLAENLYNGSYAKTYGFYSYNDRGGALYKVRTITNEDIVDEMTLIALNDNSLVAELIKDTVMNVKQFGAKGDSTHDDTTNINTAIRYVDNIFIPDGTYMITPNENLSQINGLEHGIIIPSNKTIILDNNAILQCITNDLFYYQVIVINQADNVKISGGHIYGDKLTHTGSADSEFGCVCYIYSSTNVIIENCEIAYGFGDSITIGAVNYGLSTEDNCKNIKIYNCILHDSRRQGISVISCENAIIKDCEIYNISGIAPQSGIDIEANYDSNPVKDVIIENCNIHDTNSFSLVITVLAENITVNNTKLNSISYVSGSKITINNSNISTNIYLRENDITVNNSLLNNISLDFNGLIKLYGCKVLGVVTTVERENLHQELHAYNTYFNHNSETAGSGTLFLIRTSSKLYLNGCIINSNNNYGSIAGNELIITNCILNPLSSSQNGFYARKFIFTNNVINGTTYRLVNMQNDTDGRISVISNNTFNENPTRLIGGTSTQRIFVTGNISKNALLMGSSEDNTDIYQINNYNINSTL